jgi:hypothetical protein
MYSPLYHLDKLHILEKTEQVIREVIRTCKGIKDDDFFHKKDHFSAANHLNHLEAAYFEIWSKLFTPKLILRWKFGKTRQASFSYEQMEETCQQLMNEETAERLEKLFIKMYKQQTVADKNKRLEQFSKNGERYLNEIRFYWEDNQMDTYQIPHEQLGLITAREWIYYIIIFSWRQLNKIRKFKEEYRYHLNDSNSD